MSTELLAELEQLATGLSDHSAGKPHYQLERLTGGWCVIVYTVPLHTGSTHDFAAAENRPAFSTIEAEDESLDVALAATIDRLRSATRIEVAS